MARGVFRRDPARQPYRRRTVFLPSVFTAGGSPFTGSVVVTTANSTSAATGSSVVGSLAETLDNASSVPGGGPSVSPATLLHPVLFSPSQQFMFLAEDILSGQIKASLPLDASVYDDTLNRPGALSAGIPVTSSFATEELLDPWRTAIYVLRDGKVEWGGVLVPPSLSLGGSVLQIDAFGWLGYWDHRDIRTDYMPVSVDQFDIFAQLIDDAQDEGIYGDGWDLGITVTWAALSGVTRDRTDDYRPWKTKNLGEALRQLAAVIDGFDYAMTYTLNTTTDRIDKAIRLYYPRKGRTTNYLFEYERGAQTNIISRGFADPIQFAWVGDGWGSGTDELRSTSPYVDESLRGVYPSYDASPSWSEVSVQETLDENTAAWFARNNRPKRIPVLRVDPTLYPLWGDFEIGDTVGVRIDDGYGSTAGIVPEAHRITGTRVSVAENTYDLVVDALGDTDA